jgi:hypothetical protein
VRFVGARIAFCGELEVHCVGARSVFCGRLEVHFVGTRSAFYGGIEVRFVGARNTFLGARSAFCRPILTKNGITKHKKPLFYCTKTVDNISFLNSTRTINFSKRTFTGNEAEHAQCFFSRVSQFKR